MADPGYFPDFSNGYFQLYQYEPFFYRFSYPAGHTAVTNPLSNTSVNLYNYLVSDASGITFRGSNGYNTISSATGETLVLVDSAGVLYSNTVFAGKGRFTDPSGSPLVSNVVVYANEPFAGLSFQTVAGMNPATAFVQPVLPAQLQFVGVTSNLFQLQGLPAVSGANSSFLFVASNTTSQVVSSTINIQIRPERVQLVGGPVTKTLTVGVPIVPVVFTAAMPVTASNLMYSLPSVPSGLGFTDISGNSVSYSFFPTDPSGTLILTGTPTIDSPIGMTSNLLQYTLGVQATSIFAGRLSNSTSLTFSYTPTIIFAQPTNNVYLPTLTVGLPVPTTSAYLFSARTVFGTGTSINSILATGLPAGLSISSSSGTARLTGTPLAASSGIYTVTATDVSAGLTGSIQVGIVAIQDVVTLSSFGEEQLRFVIGRPLSNALAGYYSSNLSLTATSSTGQTLVFTFPQFAQAGITATSNVTSSGTVLTFGGTPTVLVPSTFGAVTAQTPTASTGIAVSFSVVDDVFTWSYVTGDFQRNRVITPIQLNATTLSGRVIISYSTSGLPQGLTCSRNGLITGTCLGGGNGEFTATASTGISTLSRLYSYSVDPDALLLTASPTSYSLAPSTSVPPIQTIAVSYSGVPVTSYSLTPPSYGLTIDASAGIIGGTLSAPANLIRTAPIVVNALVGTFPVSSTFTLTSSSVPVNQQLAIGSNKITPLYTYFTDSLVSGAGVGTAMNGGTPANPYGDTATTAASDIQADGNNVVASFSQLGSNGQTIFGSLAYGDATAFPLSLSAGFPTPRTGRNRSAFSVAYSGSGSTWFALGQGYNTSDAFGQVYLHVSSNNGATWTEGYYTEQTPANWAITVNNPLLLPNNPFFPATLDSNWYDTGAVVLRRSGSIYMAGGGSLIRTSPSTGTTTPTMVRITSMTGGTLPPGEEVALSVPAWTRPTGSFLAETRDFALEGSTWVAAGSDSNYVYARASGNPSGGGIEVICQTLKWSSNSGVTWSNATSGGFNYTAGVVVYGGGRWVALGQDTLGDLTDGLYKLKTSTNGKDWGSTVNLGLTRKATVSYANSQWIVADSNVIYMNNSNFSTGWTSVTPPVQGISRFSGTFSVVNPLGSNSVLSTPVQDAAIQLATPQSLNYAVMQYRYIAPIALTLQGQSNAYFFAVLDTFPLGITFDPLSATFSGMPVTTGKTTVRVYATTGGANYNYFDFFFEVYSPYPQKRQDTASAFTAYVRQEAIIAGAQFSRDFTARPSQNTTVGAAMGPAPPVVQTADYPPCCR